MEFFKSVTAKPEKWPAFQVERRALDALRPYEKNARTHSSEQVEQIAASIREWGWTQPILIDENNGVIAGHGRLDAARMLDVPEVPVIVASGWSEAQKRAYVLADNQLALNAGWDEDLLRVEIAEIGEFGFDTGIVGFSDDFLAGLMNNGTGGLTDPDDVPDAPVDPVTVRGDIWVCGNHRVMCGDSTVETDVAAVLNGVKPHLMVTDPPYGVEYDANWRNDAEQAGKSKTDWTKRGRAVGKVENDDRANWSEAWALFAGDVAYVWHGALHSGTVLDSLTESGFAVRAQIVWAKSHIAISRGHYHWQHEPCWYAVRNRTGASGHWNGDRKQSTLWQIDKPRKSETGHSTQKPVECMRRPIVNNSSPGQAVYEPFCGSGTTMIAAEMEGRHAYCIELSEAYCDVIVNRWQAFTGASAVLESTGQTFDEVSAERERQAA